MQNTEFLSHLPVYVESRFEGISRFFSLVYALQRTNVFFLQTLFPNSIAERWRFRLKGSNRIKVFYHVHISVVLRHS